MAQNIILLAKIYKYSRQPELQTDDFSDFPTALPPAPRARVMATEFSDAAQVFYVIFARTTGNVVSRVAVMSTRHQAATLFAG